MFGDVGRSGLIVQTIESNDVSVFAVLDRRSRTSAGMKNAPRLYIETLVCDPNTSTVFPHPTTVEDAAQLRCHRRTVISED